MLPRNRAIGSTRFITDRFACLREAANARA